MNPKVPLNPSQATQPPNEAPSATTIGAPMTVDPSANVADAELNAAGSGPETQPGLPRSPGDEARPGSPQTAEQICPDCGGSGRRDEKPCATCGGSGRVVRILGDA